MVYKNLLTENLDLSTLSNRKTVVALEVTLNQSLCNLKGTLKLRAYTIFGKVYRCFTFIIISRSHIRVRTTPNGSYGTKGKM